MNHTCETMDRSNCEPCMMFEVELWGLINGYAISVGGDPSKHIHGNTSRMKVVAEVNKIFAKVLSRQRIDDIVVEDLAKSSNAAAAYACGAGAEVSRLRAALTSVRGFLRSFARSPGLASYAHALVAEAAVLDRVLDKKKETRR